MYQKIILSAFAFFVAVGFALAPAAAIAQINPPGNPPTTQGGDRVQAGLEGIRVAFPEGARENVDVAAVARKVINWALYLAAIIAVIFIIIGGFMYITSAGDQTKATKGRQTLVNALIGLTLVVLAYIIVQIVYRFITMR